MLLPPKNACLSLSEEMIELQLKVFDPQDKEHLVYDYLLDLMPRKLFNFVESHGLQEKNNIKRVIYQLKTW